MSVSIPKQVRSGIVYPETDGKPMAENTLQFEWIVTIKEGLETVFRDRAEVFVAGDLFWYPVEGRPDICTSDINGLGLWSCWSELWIQSDLPFFTTRHTTTSSPRLTAVSSPDSVVRE